MVKVEKTSVECLVLTVDTFITLCPQRLWEHGGREDRKHVRVRGWGGVLWNNVFWAWYSGGIHELTLKVVV